MLWHVGELGSPGCCTLCLPFITFNIIMDCVNMWTFAPVIFTGPSVKEDLRKLTTKHMEFFVSRGSGLTRKINQLTNGKFLMYCCFNLWFEVFTNTMSPPKIKFNESILLFVQCRVNHDYRMFFTVADFMLILTDQNSIIFVIWKGLFS